MAGKAKKVVSMNMAAVDAGIANVHKVDVPEAWAEAPDDEPAAKLVGTGSDPYGIISTTFWFRPIRLLATTFRFPPS